MFYLSPVKLGTKYTEPRTEISGHAIALFFNQHGCVEVCLEFAKEGKTETAHFPQERLVDKDDVSVMLYDARQYESDIVLGHKYEDTQTGIKGHATVVEFHEFMSNRCTIRGVTTNADGSEKMTYYSIDDFLLKDFQSGQVAARKSPAPSPVSREVKRR